MHCLPNRDGSRGGEKILSPLLPLRGGPHSQCLGHLQREQHMQAICHERGDTRKLFLRQQRVVVVVVWWAGKSWPSRLEQG